VQGVLATAARRLLGPDVRVTGASRTDAGVHALLQSASLVAQRSLPALAVGNALNAGLPSDIRVLRVREAPAGFDARRAAAGKRYAYLIDRHDVAHPLLRRFAWHVPRRLDAAAMREALGGLRGRRDFSALCAAPGRGKDPWCTLRAVHVVERRRSLALVVSADRFLHHMVRNLVGSLLLVGGGDRDPAWLETVLRGRDRRRAGPTAPAHGLTLVRVLYPRYDAAVSA
jgi:tRNA pseudouridine38-40 synthase